MLLFDLVLTPLQILGGIANWGFGLLGIGSLLNENQRTGEKGTLVWKNKTVTQEVYRDLLISKLIPAIPEKWPHRDRISRRIFIQQDGAKNHIHEDDEEFNNALMVQNNNTKLYMQTLC